MKKLFSRHFIVVLLLNTSFAVKDADRWQAEGDKNNILWSSTRKLSWIDFQGTSDTFSKYKAHTFSKISTALISYNNDSIVYDIPCFFIVKKSWVKSIKTDELLKHEQLHFDIAELSARKIRQEYIKHQIVETKKTYKFILDTFEKYGKNELNDLNKLYDSETNHGLIKGKQKEWEARIAKGLKELDNYSNTRVVIKR